MALFTFTNAQSVREISTASYKTETALRAAVVAALAAQAAVAGGSFSCTVSVSAYGQQDIQNVVRDLVNNDFTVTQSGSTLTISW